MIEPEDVDDGIRWVPMTTTRRIELTTAQPKSVLDSRGKLEDALDIFLCRYEVILQFFPEWASGTKRRLKDLNEAWNEYKKVKEENEHHRD